MNGKFEDKLAQLAFGEITGDEAARIEAQVANDPEALRVLATYRSMKGGLTDLAEVPEDQLSKERLRHAILMGGLKPKPVEKASPWGWLWMPATAALVAAGMVMLNGQRGGGEPMVAINGSNVLAPEVSLKDNFNFSPKPSASKVASKTSKPERTLVAVEQPKPRIRQEVPQEPEYYGEEIDFDQSIDRFKPSFVVSTSQDDKSPITNSVDNPPSHDTSSNGGIVIIENNVDENTGAYKATEVGTASNVLIGG